MQKKRLTQVLANLLSNAASFMGPGGTINVTAFARRYDGCRPCRDMGFGIPQERIETLLELQPGTGTSLPHRRRLGIGLALARHIVELHGGSITVVSAGLVRGSEFEISLPLAEPDVPASEHGTDLAFL